MSSALSGPREFREPQHPFQPTHRDASGEGHDCKMCHPESIWKCDEAAHERRGVLPDLTPIDGLEAPDFDLKPEQREQLAEMQRTRRKGLDESLHKGLA